MSELSGTAVGALFGGAVGIGIALGLFLLRRHAFRVSVAAGWGSLGLMVFGVLAGVGILVQGQNRGGDAAMYSIMFFIAGAVGLAIVAILALGVAHSHGVRLGHSFGESWLSGLSDFVLIIAAVLLFLKFGIEPLEKGTTDVWWQQELARRKRVESMKNAIPAPYREVTVHELDFEAKARRQAAQIGQNLPRRVPQDVENKIRNYELERGKPRPMPDTSGYAKAREMRTSFMASIALGWLTSVAILPAVLLRRR